jgi:hypothetical protein
MEQWHELPDAITRKDGHGDVAVLIQFQLISKSPTTEHQIGRAPFGPME